MTSEVMGFAPCRAHSGGMSDPSPRAAQLPAYFRNPRLFRGVMNLYPPYWGTGISVASVSPDWRRVEVAMRQRPWNMNAFGTHFGGSLYSMCDPHFALQLVALLGPGYTIWDKAATIEFVKPARGTVTTLFTWSDGELGDILARTADGGKAEPSRTLEVTDASGEAVARLSKVLYVRRKRGA